MNECLVQSGYIDREVTVTVLTNMDPMHASKIGKRAVEIIFAVKCFPNFVLLVEEFISWVLTHFMTKHLRYNVSCGCIQVFY